MSLDNSHFNQLRYLTLRALKSRYAGTALGTIWAFGLPLMQITVYVIVFGFLFKSKLPGSDTSLTYVIWFLLGYSPWMLVSECLPGSASCMQANAGLIKSFPLNKPIIVYSVVLAALPQLALCLVFSSLLIIFTGNVLNPLLLSYQVLGLFGLFLIVINSSLFMSLLGLVFRDLSVVLPQLLMMLLFASPVFFPVSVLPWPLTLIAKWNPLIISIDMIRAPIQQPTPLTIVLSVVGVPLGLLLWRIVLRRYRRYEGVIASMV